MGVVGLDGAGGTEGFAVGSVWHISEKKVKIVSLAA
jgi:hypothetical protein